jgi:xanthine dehydrogenase accessory factor
MKELKEIVRAYDEASKLNKEMALVTLVHAEGSSYRRPGARMLVTVDGELTGAISGGCLEGDALNKALFAMQQQKNSLVTYDTNEEEDAVMGLGLGCNGIIQVLIEPLRPSQNAIDFLKRIISERRSYIVVTLFSLRDRRSAQTGTCMLYDGELFQYIGIPDGFLDGELEKDVQRCFHEQKTLFRNFITSSGEVTACIEFIAPPVALVIAGSGNDAAPVVAIANTLGWETTLIDDGRDKNKKAGRFAASCLLLVPNAENVLKQVKTDERTCFVLMTHNYHYDMAMLKQLLKTDVKYIGMLGPRKKLNRILDELRQAGEVLDPKRLAAVYGPAGLNIGAETPEEIALSIIAEIKAVLTERPGQSLREIDDTIHPRSETKIETRIIHSIK